MKPLSCVYGKNLQISPGANSSRSYETYIILEHTLEVLQSRHETVHAQHTPELSPSISVEPTDSSHLE